MARIRFLLLLLSLAAAPLFAAPVQLIKTASGWHLEVAGKPFFIKGVGCHGVRGAHGEDYLKMARDMGANAVRTWGVVPGWYFDQAAANGLLVDAGVWLNPGRFGMPYSYANAHYRRHLTLATLTYVRQMKHHPALLSWNLGNEVFAHTDSQRERKAFGEFLNELVDAVHKEDPSHPVIYSSVDGTLELSYLKAYVPNLDIVGINTYDGYLSAIHWLTASGYDKPVIATEFGCRGAWGQPKDSNHVPEDPFDQDKAADYAALWRQIEGSHDQSLGGFAFVLGAQRNQDSLTWFNLNYGWGRRRAFWDLYTLYTGKRPANACPRIDALKVDPAGGLAPGAWARVRAVASDPDGDRLSYGYFVTNIAVDPLIVDPPRFYPAPIVHTGPGAARLVVPDHPGIYRVYVLVGDGHDNVAVADRSIRVMPSQR